MGPYEAKGPAARLSLFAGGLIVPGERQVLLANVFVRFCRDTFKLLLMAARITETREKPVIPIGLIFVLMVVSLALGRGSFHQIDLFARVPALRKLLGTRRNMVASDTTVERVLPDIDAEEVREALQEEYLVAKRGGAQGFRLASGRRLGLAIVDGTDLRDGLASTLAVVSDRGVFLLDAEPYEKGKELAGSTRVIQRAVRRHGKGLADIVLTDALYVSAPFWKACRSLGLDVLAKGEADTKEDLVVLREARALIAAGENDPRIEVAQGVDTKRGVSYVVKAVAGLQHEGYDGTLKVALVEETRLKPRKGRSADRPSISRSWVMTTKEDLTAEEMRELGHLRWEIENNGFRALNGALKSKRVWTRNDDTAKTFLVLTLLMFLAFNLATAFNASLDMDDVRNDLCQGKGSCPHAKTLRLIVDRILQTLEHATPLVPTD